MVLHHERERTLDDAIKALEGLDSDHLVKQKELGKDGKWAEVSRIQSIREGIGRSIKILRQMRNHRLEVMR